VTYYCRRAPLVLAAVLSAGVLMVRAPAASSKNADAIPPRIEAMYSSGSYKAAADALQTDIGRSPKDASLYHWLGRCYFELHDFDSSISNWEHAVALDSARSEYHDWLGRAYGRKAERDSHTWMASALSLARKTHHEFELAVQLDANNTQAQRDLIDFMASAPRDLGGGEQNALNQIRVLLSVDSLEGMLAQADFYAERKKFEQADDEYQKILNLAPSRIEAYFEAADYYCDRSDSAHFAQAVDAAWKAAPSDRRLNYYLGVGLVLEDKDSDTAEKDLRTYIETVPQNSELPSHSSAYEYLGKLYENRRQPDLALEQYKAASAIDPQNKELHEALKRLQKQ